MRSNYHNSFDRSSLSVKSLSERSSKFGLDIFVDPHSNPPKLPSEYLPALNNLAVAMNKARKNKKPIIFTMGAHVIKNGLSLVLIDLMDRGYIQHILGNGAVSIHDWEFAFQGRTAEDVRKYVSEGQFGIWDETGRYLNGAIKMGAKKNMGYGESVGMMIEEEKLGRRKVPHLSKHFSLLGNAFKRKIPFSIAIGIGHDIIQTHPSCDGASLGKASYIDFMKFAETVKNLEGGVLVSTGSAVMAPMVFEKSLSMAKNYAKQAGKKLENYDIVVNDIQPSSWDWSKGDPPMDNPDYYLRFLKTFYRMGGRVSYVPLDNKIFLHNLSHMLAD